MACSRQRLGDGLAARAGSSNDSAQASALPSELATQIPCGAGFVRLNSAYNLPSIPPGGLLTRAALSATGTKSLLIRRITSALAKTASRAAPANTQHRSSSVGRSIKIQSITGLRCSREALRPSMRQVFHAISRHSRAVRPVVAGYQNCWRLPGRACR
jgi:hypothetical protein